MKGGILMKKYILVTLRNFTNPKSMIYGYQICIAKECRFWENVPGCGWSIGWREFYTLSNLIDNKNTPVPKFETVEEAKFYFHKYIDRFKSKKELSIYYLKLFTRVTTLDKLENFIKNNNRPYYSYGKSDSSYLDEVIGPAVIF